MCLFPLTKKLCVWTNSLLNTPFSLPGPYTCLVFYILIVNLAFNIGVIFFYEFNILDCVFVT